MNHETHAATPYLLSQFKHGVLTLTLNRPEKFNPLSQAMLDELQTALDQIAQDPTVRVVILAAQGKAFCAGHDLRQLLDQATPDYCRNLFRQCGRLMLAIQQLPQPVIARVQGIATAAGCQLVSMCDLAVAADTARFAVSGINFGLFCATPAVGLSRNIARKKALELLFTGDFIDAQQALSYGLINEVATLEQLDPAIDRLVQNLLTKPAHILALGKKMFYQQLEMGIEAAYQLAEQTMAWNMMDPAAQEGIQAFLEKRPPHWRQKS